MTALFPPPAQIGDVLIFLQHVKRFGELGCVDVGGRFWGPSGKKPPTKDVWMFPRHMLNDLDAAIATLERLQREGDRG